MSRCLPSRCAVKAFPEETIHEARHRQATAFGLVEERTRDDRLVAGSFCHQISMPREGGLLQTPGGAGFGFEPWEEATAENQFAPCMIGWIPSPDFAN